MPTVFVPTPESFPSMLAPRITAASVLCGAFVVVFFTAWLVVLGQVAIFMRAELRLASILSEANQFAELPSARAHELKRLVDDRVEQAGWTGARVRLAPVGKSRHRVAAIELPADQVVPEWIRPLPRPRMERPLRAVGAASDGGSWFGGK